MNDSFWPDPRSRPRPAAFPENSVPDATENPPPEAHENSPPAVSENPIPASTPTENTVHDPPVVWFPETAKTPRTGPVWHDPAPNFPYCAAENSARDTTDASEPTSDSVWPRPDHCESDEEGFLGFDFSDQNALSFEGVLGEADGYPLEWLWENRFPRGQLVLLSGARGVGKTFLACDWAARITRGDAWPGETAGTGSPGRVLFVAPTPRLLMQIQPRLLAACADLSQIEIANRRYVRTRWDKGGSGLWTLDDPEYPFQNLLDREERFDLIVVETLEEFTDATLPAAARTEQLGNLEYLLQEYGTTVLCVTTPARSARGGIDWEREPGFSTVWGAIRDPFAKEKRLLLPIQTTFGPPRGGLGFRIEPTGGAGRVVWYDEPETISFAELTGNGTASDRRGGSGAVTQTAIAEVWLRSFLRGGAQPTVEILREGAALGLSTQPIRTALGRVGVKHKQGNGGAWSWSLHENVQNSRETS